MVTQAKVETLNNYSNNQQKNTVFAATQEQQNWVYTPSFQEEPNGM